VERIAVVQLAAVQYQARRRDLLRVDQLQTEQLAVESNVSRLRNTQTASASASSFTWRSAAALTRGWQWLC
jgi:hypothetical protein